ncbi:MAG: dihydrodipicolinate synthase family protein [Candidatus Sericytochromatia bacterium]
MAKKVQGLFASLVTPFKKDSLEIDFDALMDLVTFVSDNGADGIIPLSSYGEFPSITLAEKKEVLLALSEVKDKMSFIPQIGSSNFEETLELAKHAVNVKADAIIIVPPYFYRDVQIEGLINYYEKIIKSVNIPVYLYHIPKFSLEISDILIEKLMETEQIAGIKDSSDNIVFSTQLKMKYPELNIILSNEHLFYSGLNLGITAFASSLFNAFPEVIKSITFDYNQPKKGGKAAQNYINEIYSILKSYPRISALKYATSLRGLAESHVRPPLISLSKDQQKSLKEALIKYITSPIIID